MKKQKIILLITILFNLNILFSQEIKIYSLVDKSNTLSFEDILNSNFKEVEQNNLFVKRSTPTWFRIKCNALDKNNLLIFEKTIIDTLEVYRLTNNSFTKKTYGSSFPFRYREYKNQNFIINIDRNETVYVRINTFNNTKIPIYLTNKNQLNKNQTKNNFIYGIFFGILIGLFLYNLSVCIVLKSEIYLYYILFLFFIIIFYILYEGFGFHFFFPNIPKLNTFNNQPVNLSYIAASLFYIKYFKINKKSIDYKINLVFILISTLAIIFSLFFQKINTVFITELIAILLSIFFIYLGAKFYSNEKSHTIFHLFAWSLYLLCIIIFILHYNDFIPYNFYISKSLQLGTILKFVLLSFALTLRINTYKQEEKSAKKEEINQFILNQKIIKDQRKDIEKQILQKTKSYGERANKLMDTNKKLRASLLLLTNKKNEILSLNNNDFNYEKYVELLKKSLIPKDKKINNILSNSFFILSKTNNPLNADFYWISEVNEKIIIAVGNSINSGLNGNLEMLLCLNYLKSIIDKSQNTKPDDILTSMFNLFINKYNDINNGIRLAILSLDKNQRKIQLSSNFNDIFITENNKIRVIKGDKNLINKKNMDIKFTNYSLSPKNQINIYLSSSEKLQLDNVLDLQNKNFISKIKEHLLSIENHSMNQQKEEISKWIQKEEYSPFLNESLIFGIQY